MPNVAPGYNVGEEVLFEGERFVIAGLSEGPAYRFRLLATSSLGARVAWAQADQITRLQRYTAPHDDTFDH